MKQLNDTNSGRYRFYLGRYEKQTNDILENWKEIHFLERLWKKDWSLWFEEKKTEITNRLGWLRLPQSMPQKRNELIQFAETVRNDGITRIVLLGMGGSSLAPEVFQSTFNNARGYPELSVLDSTHPESVLELDGTLDYPHTFFLVSSKSGTTLETRCFYQYFWQKCQHLCTEPGDHFAAVTDAGSPLEAISRKDQFRGIFLPPEDVGGRYSAFTEFGLIPAALIGLDLNKLLQEGQEAADAHIPDADPAFAPGLVLGALLGAAADTCNKITIWASPSLRHFPDWMEQLIAESTGKNGKGLIPVVNEPLLDADQYSRDRLFVFFDDKRDRSKDQLDLMRALVEAGHPVVHIVIEDEYQVGQDIFIWEMGIAAAGAVMDIHPFNQPDVQLAKDLARQAMRESGEKNEHSLGNTFNSQNIPQLSAAVKDWLLGIETENYIAVQAYLPDGAEIKSRIEELKNALLKRTGAAVTSGWGPRFLHSTGQLHKGGPGNGVFLQLVDEPAQDAEVPEAGFTFGQLIYAQAAGDYQALRKRDRKVLRINLKDNRISGIETITAVVEGGR